MRNDIITGDFTGALRDYSYLLNRAYPRKATLKIIGDRYLLNTFQRILLNRGIFPDEAAKARIARTTGRITGEELYIDTYNILLILSNYLLGRIVFIGNDRFVRDAGEVFGKPHRDPVFDRSIGLLAGYLEKNRPSRVEFLIDRPVSYSAELAGKLREILTKMELSGDASLERNPDAVLIRLEKGIVATSDSDVLNQTTQPVTDLAHAILRDHFTPGLIDLNTLLS